MKSSFYFSSANYSYYCLVIKSEIKAASVCCVEIDKLRVTSHTKDFTYTKQCWNSVLAYPLCSFPSCARLLPNWPSQDDRGCAKDGKEVEEEEEGHLSNDSIDGMK